jgi:hypothetical protein
MYSQNPNYSYATPQQVQQHYAQNGGHASTMQTVPVQHAGGVPVGYGNYPGAYAGVALDQSDYDGLADYMQDETVMRNVQFGIIDNGLLVAMALMGLSLEDYIAEKVGTKGYGVLLGATIGNAFSDGVAALPQGKKAAASVTAGALLPVLPILGAVALKKQPKGMTKNVLIASSAAMLAFAFFGKKIRQGAGESA